MTSKRPTNKRARLPRTSDRTREFIKDWHRLNAAGRFDMARLKTVMMMIVANEGPLPPEYRDHPLSGSWRDYRDCHVHGDFLLLYKMEGRDDAERVVFARIGTHSDLFG